MLVQMHQYGDLASRLTVNTAEGSNCAEDDPKVNLSRRLRSSQQLLSPFCLDVDGWCLSDWDVTGFSEPRPTVGALSAPQHVLCGSAPQPRVAPHASMGIGGTLDLSVIIFAH